MKAASAVDYRELARRRLPPFLFEYIDGGSYAEVTLRRNVTELERIELRQRVLRNVSKIDTSTTLFGAVHGDAAGARAHRTRRPVRTSR